MWMCEGHALTPDLTSIKLTKVGRQEVFSHAYKSLLKIMKKQQQIVLLKGENIKYYTLCFPLIIISTILSSPTDCERRHFRFRKFKFMSSDTKRRRRGLKHPNSYISTVSGGL